MFKLLNEFFIIQRSIESVNKTLLVLILRVEIFESFKQLISIGLCNVIYKIVLKIMKN